MSNPDWMKNWEHGLGSPVGFAFSTCIKIPAHKMSLSEQTKEMKIKEQELN